MRRIKQSILIIIFSSILFINALAHVGLDYPVGGENFQAGEVVEIRWHIVIYHGACDWDLLFSNDGGSNWQPIISNLQESQLSYSWTIPNMATDSGQVKVVQDNATGMDYSDASGNFIINIGTGIKSGKNHIDKFVLYSAYPNPFNPVTTIRYELSNSLRITLKVYNIIGEPIKTLVDDFQSPGEKSVVWDGTNDQGKSVGSGVYLYQLQAGNEIKTKKMTLLK